MKKISKLKNMVRRPDTKKNLTVNTKLQLVNNFKHIKKVIRIIKAIQTQYLEKSKMIILKIDKNLHSCFK